MAEITLKQAQEQVDSWIKTYGVRYFNELTNMTILTEEVGELARIMARTYGEQSFKESEKHRDLGDEMADVKRLKRLRRTMMFLSAQNSPPVVRKQRPSSSVRMMSAMSLVLSQFQRLRDLLCGIAADGLRKRFP